jgi:Protein of Unknown function (DUF2784)
MDMWYQFLNYFFFVFHTMFTLFNMVGWAFKQTRRLHLATMLITAFSWFVLGIWYGWGFCLCTEWHYLVRGKLGYADQHGSYIHFLILKITGINLHMQLVENATLAVFLVAFCLSVWMNIRNRSRPK